MPGPGLLCDDGPMTSRLLLAAIVLTTTACKQQDPIAPAGPPATGSPKGSRWHSIGGSAMVAAAPAEAFPELAAAMEQARSTAGEARQRWALDPKPAVDGTRWAVKWAAPTVGGGVEHLWVRPTSWSRHRIEGWLVNAPRGTLACGRGEGALVSFAAEELSDWVHYGTGTNGSPIEGGFTIPVLETRYGQPH